MKNISVIVPFFNEENFLVESVERLLNTKLFNEIILIDDGSTDESNKLAKLLMDNNREIRLIRINKNSGKGNAIKIGLESVTSTHVIIHDADLEYFPSDVINMFEIAQKNPNTLILGSRTLSKKNRKRSLKITYYANKYFTLLFSVLNWYKLSDIASCYWLVETEKLRRMNIQESGFGIEVEVLSKILRMKCKIIETPISYEGRLYSQGKKIFYKDGINIFLKILFYSRTNIFFKF